MTIDLRYTFPIIGPFVVLGVFRALFWLAGAGWPEAADGVAVFSFLIGGIFGILLTVLALADESGLGLVIKIGGRK